MTAIDARMVLTDSYKLPRTNWNTSMDGLPAMLSTRPYLTTALTMGLDLGAALLALTISAWVRQPYDYYGMMSLLQSEWSAVLLLLLAYMSMSLYPPVGMTPTRELRLIGLSTTFIYGSLTAGAFVMGANPIHMAGFVLAWAVSLVLVSIVRTTLRLLFAHQDWWGVPVVVLSQGHKGKQRMAVRTLQNRPWLGLKPAIVLDQDGDGRRFVRGVPVIGATGEATMGAGVDPSWVRYSTVAVPGLPHELMREQLRIPGRLFFKRVFDVVLSTVAAVCVLPVVGLIALLIKLDSPGPVLFTQLRLGKNGCPFQIFKFRTMYIDGPTRIEDLPDELKEEFERFGKIRVDPRVTRVGRWLRKLSLDELPQLWNVIVGDMSLVGPRPYMREQLPMMGLFQKTICLVSPGLTGIWQVSGRSEIVFDQRLRMDADYAHNWSFGMDFWIILKTVWVVLKGKGAY